MSMSKSRLLAFGLTAAGLAGAVALGTTAPHLGRTLLPGAAQQGALGENASADSVPVRVAEKQQDGVQADPAGKLVETGRNVRVEAPYTAVNVDKERGKVRVKAPHTDVQVDPDKGQVRVRAPYVNLDIRW